MFKTDHRVRRPALEKHPVNRSCFPSPAEPSCMLCFPAYSKCFTWQRGNLLSGKLIEPLIHCLLKGVGEEEGEKGRENGKVD